MSLGEILRILWHRKLVVVLVLVVALAAGYGSLRLMKKQYEATSTLALQPAELGNSLLFFQTLDAITSIYATAADTQTTKTMAAATLSDGLAEISVRTYQSSPIIKIVARGTDPAQVQQSAQAVTDVLVERATAGQVGIKGLRLTQIDRPTKPTSPVFPKPVLTLGVAGFLGLGLGMGAALLWEVEGRRVRTRSDLAHTARTPVFAEIPEQSALQRKGSFEALVRDPDFRTVTEALRDLRTNLIFASGKYGSIAVTSPEGQHGKTTVSVGLAAAISRTGVRTILVDADLRRGRVAQMLGVESAPGLSEVLSGARLAAVVRQTPLENLDLLTGGRLMADPSELLTTRLPEIVAELEQEYEAVVIDTTPLVSVNDGRVVSRLTHSVVLVVRADRTSQRAVREAVERLDLISVDLTAAVLNRSHNRSARGYYGPEQSKVDGSAAPRKAKRPPAARR
jgi:succinoglycan biosynthesis transport protein ExoP